MDFTGPERYREEDMPLDRPFPRLAVHSLQRMFGPVGEASPHDVLVATLRQLHDGGYGEMIRTYGFHNAHNVFRWHCHQATPCLGAALLARGFEVHYLECARVHPNTLDLVSPEQEPDEDKREEFRQLGRIPYCAHEIASGVPFGERAFWVSPKHAHFDGCGQIMPRLDPQCYIVHRPTEGPPHPGDRSRSGLYLQRLNEAGAPFVWRKQTRGADEPAEFFRAFLRMRLVLPA